MKALTLAQAETLIHKEGLPSLLYVTHLRYSEAIDALYPDGPHQNDIAFYQIASDAQDLALDAGLSYLKTSEIGKRTTKAAEDGDVIELYFYKVLAESEDYRAQHPTWRSLKLNSLFFHTFYFNAEKKAWEWNRRHHCAKQSAHESKVKSYQALESVLGGKNTNIRSWGILAADNPLFVDFKHSDNPRLNQKLVNKLADHHFKYLRVKGKYDSTNAFFVMNPGLTDMKKFSASFHQGSFIYAEAIGNIEDGMVSTVYYYELNIDEARKEGASFSYSLKYKSDPIRHQSDMDDFVSYLSSESYPTKFDMALSISDSLIRESHYRLERMFYGISREEVEGNLAKSTVDSTFYGEQARWLCRGYLYRISAN